MIVLECSRNSRYSTQSNGMKGNRRKGESFNGLCKMKINNSRRGAKGGLRMLTKCYGNRTFSDEMQNSLRES